MLCNKSEMVNALQQVRKREMVCNKSEKEMLFKKSEKGKCFTISQKRGNVLQ